ncbi:ATP synthase subunit delta [Pleomorphomonas sp. SM30]|nr:ATP synthase subunit delta [Pleomorphomonas sp. SM30]GLS75271.1 ATP synthase subunit delta [Oharaeibacter diazotrophicus]
MRGPRRSSENGRGSKAFHRKGQGPGVTEGEPRVSETATVVSGVAERYANALFELGVETGQLDGIAADIDRFDALLAESADLVRLIRSPVFTPDDQLRAVSEVMFRAGIGGLAANFVKLAARNRRLFAVPEMFRAYRKLLAHHRGETTADVVSAETLSAAQVGDLKAALTSVTGRDIRVNAAVDPSLIGGLVVKLGSRMIDTSLKTKLNALKIALKEVG